MPVELRLLLLDNNEGRASFTARPLVFPANPTSYISGAIAAISALTDAVVIGARLYYVWPSVPYEPQALGVMAPALYLYRRQSDDDWQYINGQIAADYAYNSIIYRDQADPLVVQLADEIAAIAIGEGYQLQVIATEVYV